MDSNTKPKLTVTQLEKLVTFHSGMRIKTAVEMTDGWANTAYRICLENDRQIVLKVSPASTMVRMRYEIDIMRTEVEVLKQLHNKIPVPYVYAYDDSCRLLPHEYYLMEFLEGSPYNKVKSSMTEAQREAIEFQLGQYNQIINEVKGTSFGPYSSPVSYGDDWPTAFSRMLLDVLEDARDMNVSLPVGAIDVSILLQEAEEALREVTEPRLVHWDLWDGNFFVQDETIVGIIDFERALWGDPLLEFYLRHMNHSPAFLRGYQMTNFTASQEIRRSLYDLYLDLILVVQCYFYQYNNQELEQWARNCLAKSWGRVIQRF
ncbi:Phosphotransferase enzyme family protein [compost metagenome]